MIRLECESCGRLVRDGEIIADTYELDGCDHWYIKPSTDALAVGYTPEAQSWEDEQS